MQPIVFYDFLTQVMGYFYLFFQYICHALMIPFNAHVELSTFYNPFLEREFMYGWLFEDVEIIGDIIHTFNDIAMTVFDSLFNILDVGLTTSSPTWECLLFFMGFVVVFMLIIKGVTFLFS